MTITVDGLEIKSTVTDTKQSAVEAQVESIVNAIGESRENVRVLEPKWADLLANGAIVTPHVYRWRAESTLSLEDYGIYVKTKDEERAYRRVLKLGTGYLLPTEERNKDAQVEGQFRALFTSLRYAFKTPMGWFMPEGEANEFKGKERGWLYKEFKAEATTLQQEYVANAQRRHEHWDEILKQVEDDYIVIGVQNYERLLASGKTGLPGQETWVKQFVKRRMDRIPSRDAVRDSYAMTWDVAVVPLLSAMAQDKAIAAQIVAEEGAVSELKQDMLNSARKQFEEGIGSFMADVKSQVYGLVTGVMDDAHAALLKNQDKGSLPGSTVRQLRNLITQVERLNVWDDIQLEGQMTEVRGLLRAHATGQATTGSMSETMQRIQDASLAVLRELDRVPERAGRAVEVEGTVTGVEVIERQARAVEVTDLGAAEDLDFSGREARL